MPWGQVTHGGLSLTRGQGAERRRQGRQRAVVKGRWARQQEGRREKTERAERVRVDEAATLRSCDGEQSVPNIVRDIFERKEKRRREEEIEKEERRGKKKEKRADKRKRAKDNKKRRRVEEGPIWGGNMERREIVRWRRRGEEEEIFENNLRIFGKPSKTVLEPIGSPLNRRICEADLVASAEKLMTEVDCKVAEVVKRLQILYSGRGAHREGSLEELKKEQEEEREKQKRTNKDDELALVCQMADESSKMKTRIDATLQVIGKVETSGGTDSCLQTNEDYMRCSEQLKKLEHEMKLLEDDQVIRIRTMLEEQHWVTTQTKKEHQALLLSKLQEDSLSPSNQVRAASLRCSLGLLTSRPAMLRAPGCPACLEELRPGTRIVQCGAGHLVCLECAGQLDKFICPTCRQDFSGRATAMEQLLALVFCHDPI